jgi:flagellar protein FliS
MLYDRLCADLLRAAEAVRHHDVEARCAQIKHALLIVQQLEGSLDHEQGGPAARTLAEFYSYARAKMMEAQIKGDAQLLEKVARHFSEVRGAWQQVDPGVSTPVAARVVGEESTLSCTV